MICPNCGADNAEDNTFCQRCGSRLRDEVSAASPAEHAPPGTRSTPKETPRRSTASTATDRAGRKRIDRLGNRIDGWAELVDDKADQVEAMYQFLRQRLAERDMPLVSHDDKMLTPGGLAGEKRHYHLVTHQVGASVAVRVAEFGSDLYVAWDLFVRLVWNWGTFATIAGVAGLIGYAWEMQSSYSLFESWLVKTIALIVTITPMVGLAGLALKGNFWAPFREQYNHFSADDVTAMTLAVHDSLLEGLDHIGVNMTLIRPKKEFRAGERERII